MAKKATTKKRPPGARHPARAPPSPGARTDAGGSSRARAGFFENAVLGMFAATPDGAVLEANAALARLYGCATVDEFMRRCRSREHALFADPGAGENFLGLLRDRGAVAGFEGAAERKDGSRFWVRASGWFARDAAGAPFAIQGVVEDATDRRRHEEKRALAEQMLAGKIGLLQHMLNAVDFGICAYDRDSRLVVWNQRYLEQTYRDQMVRVGMPLIEHFKHLARLGLYGRGDADEIARQRIGMIEANGFRDRDELRRLDGRIVEIRYLPLAEGGFVATLSDVTERSRAEDELVTAKELAELANRNKTAFLAHLSHELRTPLNNVLAFAEIIRDRRLGDDRDRYVEYAGYIHDSGRELLRLADDIIDVARIEQGEFVLNPEPLDVAKAIESVQRLVAAEIQNKGIQFVVRVPEHCPALVADDKSFKQVLANVLSNAVKFTPRGGRVIVEARPGEEGAFLVRVSDTGVGMSKGQIAQAMSPFAEATTALTSSDPGAGLGLRLVRYLMERHDGRFEISSTTGAGTTVTLRFPLPAEQPAGTP